MNLTEQQPTYESIRTENRAFGKNDDLRLVTFSDRAIEEQILRTLASIDKGIASLKTWVLLGLIALGCFAAAILARIGQMRVY